MTRMMMAARRWTGVVCLLSGAASLVPGAARAQSYTITDLGTLGGDAAGADGINQLGEAVGWSIDDPYAYFGFVSAPGGPPLTSLGPPPNGDYSYALDVNDLRQVVGYGEVTVGFGEEDHAILWQNGVMTDLGTLGGGASQALAINDAGQIVALASLSGGSHAVRLDPIPGGLGLGGPEPGIVGWENTLAVRGATVGENVVFVYGFVEGASNVPGCPGLSVDIAGARILGSDFTDGNGHAVVTGVAPEAVRGRTVLFQAVERASCRVSNVVAGRF